MKHDVLRAAGRCRTGFRHGGDCRGFSLLEVLIALFVLMVGLLGVAGLQTMALSNNHSAYLRSQAVIQAHDIADRMYANPAGVAAGAYNAEQESPPTCLTTSTNVDVLAGVSCTATQIAHYDLSDWNAVNAHVLPAGDGAVTGPDGNGAYTITLTWVDNQQSESFSFQVKPLP